MYPIPNMFATFVEQPPKLAIQEVIYNDPATIVKWTDGDKTVVKCHEGDEYDPKLGLLYCIAKKTFGGGRYNDILAKHLPKAKVEAKTKTEKLDWDRFSKGEVVVNCKTREAADDFLKKCEKRGFNWACFPATDRNNWGFHGDKTCYRYFDSRLGYCYRSHHEFYGREVFEWEPKAPKFDWKGFKNGEFSVECKTVKAAKKFNRKCEKHGITPFPETIVKYLFHRSEKFMIAKDGDKCGLYRGRSVDENLPVKEYK